MTLTTGVTGVGVEGAGLRNDISKVDCGNPTSASRKTLEHTIDPRPANIAAIYLEWIMLRILLDKQNVISKSSVRTNDQVRTTILLLSGKLSTYFKYKHTRLH